MCRCAAGWQGPPGSYVGAGAPSTFPTPVVYMARMVFNLFLQQNPW